MNETSELIQCFNEIYKRIIEQVKSRSKYGVKGRSDAEDILEIYRDVMIKYLFDPDSSIAIDKYRMPNPLPFGYNIQDDYIKGYMSNIHPKIFLKTMDHYKTYKINSNSQVSLEKASDIEYYDIKDREGVLEQADAEKIINKFTALMNKNDRLLFQEVMKGTPITAVQELTGLYPKTIKSRYSKYAFLFSLFLLSNEKYLEILDRDESKLKNYINKESFWKMKYFGSLEIRLPNYKTLLSWIMPKKKNDKKLQEPIKPNEDLKLIELIHNYYGSDNTVIVDNNEKYIAKSKMDLRGKKHRHYVTYINRSGFAFSHLDKSVIKLV